jgi:hypothetical protein
MASQKLAPISAKTRKQSEMARAAAAIDGFNRP